MPRFIFKLEPLLKARRREEQTRQRAVAVIERERLELEQRLQRQQRAISEGKHELRDELLGVVNVTQVRFQATAALQVMRQAQRMVLELAGVHKRLAGARGELIEAAKTRRALELLKESRFARWKAGIEKAEVAALDELAVQQAARQERES
jgi:flagellar FliJ protein